MTSISIRIAEPGSLRSLRPSAAVLKSLVNMLLSRLRNIWCVINGGHFKVLHTEPQRLALRCVACGHTSPGWEVGSLRVQRVPADSDRVRVQRPIAA